MGDMEISKYNIMGGEGLKKITIYILRHNGGRSKNGGGGGGNLFQSNFDATKDTEQNF